jgi:hypothetical protein
MPPSEMSCRAALVTLLRSMFQLLLNANVVLSSPILVTSIMEVVLSSETSVLPRTTRHHIAEDGILHSHRSENLKSYIALTGWALLRRRNVSPVKYELRFYITEEAIFRSHRRENLKSYIHCCGL